MQLTIDITDKQVEFLKKFAEKQGPGAADNLFTYKPIHIVQKMEYTYIPYSYELENDLSLYSNENIDLVYVTDGEYNYSDRKELVRDEYECAGKEKPTDEIFEEFKDYDDLNFFSHFELDVDIFFRVGYYVNVAFFLIREEAQRYIEYQSHNLPKKTRIYTYGPGYANYGEYEHFYDLLMNMGMQLNKEKTILEEMVEQN